MCAHCSLPIDPDDHQACQDMCGSCAKVMDGGGH